MVLVQYVTCKTALDLLSPFYLTLLTNAGSKRLADLDIKNNGAEPVARDSINSMRQHLIDCIDKMEEMLRLGCKYADPAYTVLGICMSAHNQLLIQILGPDGNQL